MNIMDSGVVIEPTRDKESKIGAGSLTEVIKSKKPATTATRLALM
jgi:hypothetical protein